MSVFRATCGPDGKWSHPLPSCLSPCIVPEVVNGRMEGFNIGAKVEHGWAVAVNCSEDYEVGKTSWHFSKILMNTFTGEQLQWRQLSERDLEQCAELRARPLQDHPRPAQQRHDRGGRHQPRLSGAVPVQRHGLMSRSRQYLINICFCYSRWLRSGWRCQDWVSFWLLDRSNPDMPGTASSHHLWIH